MRAVYETQRPRPMNNYPFTLHVPPRDGRDKFWIISKSLPAAATTNSTKAYASPYCGYFIIRYGHGYNGGGGTRLIVTDPQTKPMTMSLQNNKFTLQYFN